MSVWCEGRLGRVSRLPGCLVRESRSICSTATLARISSALREKVPSATKLSARFFLASRPAPGTAIRGSKYGFRLPSALDAMSGTAAEPSRSGFLGALVVWLMRSVAFDPAPPALISLPRSSISRPLASSVTSDGFGAAASGLAARLERPTCTACCIWAARSACVCTSACALDSASCAASLAAARPCDIAAAAAPLATAPPSPGVLSQRERFLGGSSAAGSGSGIAAEEKGER